MTGGSTVHYRCTFDLKPAATTVPWSDLPKQIRSWIGSKTEKDLGIGGRWFFEGGQTEVKGKARLAVATARDIGTGSAEAPQFWSIRFDHPCSEVTFRQWRTDIGLTCADEGVRFSLLTRHWIRDGYIGEEPPPPLPSAPGIVGRLLRAKLWGAFAGSQRLSDGPLALPPGQGMSLKAAIENPARLSTIVLVTREFGTEKTLVDSAKLSRLLAGVATVIEAQTAEVNRELEWVLPKGFRCWGGMVRVYQPGIRFDRESDARRHRYFFHPDQTVELAASVVEDLLVTGIARRSGFQPTDALTTIEDVTALQREHRLAELRKAADDTSLGELVELLENDNDGLRTQLATKDEEFKWASEISDDLLTKNDALSAECSKLAGERNYWKDTVLKANATIQQLENQAQALFGLEELPADLPAVIDLIQALHGARIVFTDRARKSAEKASSYELAVVWRCLWAMATVLPALLFDSGKKVDLEDVFKSRTGLPLALSEGGTTKKDKALMRLRKDNHEGREIDITPHVKIGSTFRVHFYVDRDNQRIIVGHCGDHLDTAGTRRMS